MPSIILSFTSGLAKSNLLSLSSIQGMTAEQKAELLTLANIEGIASDAALLREAQQTRTTNQVEAIRRKLEKR